MARVRRKGQHADLRRARRRRRSPCDRPPARPTDLTGAFDRDEGGRGAHRIRATLRWNEVTTDTSGFPIRLRAYKVEVEYSANGTDWFLRSRHTVLAKDDQDPGTKAHLVIRGLRARLQYRYHVQPVGRDGCKGEWSDYFVLGSPGPEEPPAPTNVRIYQQATNRLVVDWDETPDPEDPDRRRDDQSWFIVHWSTSQSFSTIYRRDRKVHRTQASLKVPEADEGLTFYARVAAVNDHGDKDVRSVFIPATIAGNSDPLATPDGVQIGAGGGKEKAVFHMRGRLRVLAEADSMDLDLDEALTIKKIRCRVKQPPTGQGVVVKVWKNETALVGTVTISAGTRRAVLDGLSVPVADGDGLSVEVAQVGSTYPGRHLVVKVVME